MTKKSKAPSPSDGFGPDARTVRVNGWTLLMDPLFLDQVERLLSAVERDRSDTGIDRTPNAKLLAMLTKLVYDVIPSDPERKEFRQGHTLGPHRKHWFRAKFGNGRFRLFFRFRSDVRVIVYGWVNDSETLRAYGRRTDAYAVFSRMLDAGEPPDDWDALLMRARSAAALERTQKLDARLQDRHE